MLNQVKMVAKMKKLQKELSKQQIEVAAGEGAVTVTITGEQKIKSISFDPELIDLDDIENLESWTKQAVTEAIDKSQKLAAEKLGPMMQGLNLG